MGIESRAGEDIVGNIDQVIFPKERSVLLGRTPNVFSVGLIGFQTMESAFAVVRFPEGVDSRKIHRIDYGSLEVDFKSTRQEAVQFALEILSFWKGGFGFDIHDYEKSTCAHRNFDNSYVSTIESQQRDKSMDFVRSHSKIVPIAPLLMRLWGGMGQDDTNILNTSRLKNKRK